MLCYVMFKLRVVKSKDGSTVRYVTIFARKHGTLVRYAFFGMVRYGTLVWYASKIELKYGTLVRYGLKCEVRRTQILNVPYRTAILAILRHSYITGGPKGPWHNASL